MKLILLSKASGAAGPRSRSAVRSRDGGASSPCVAGAAPACFTAASRLGAAASASATRGRKSPTWRDELAAAAGAASTPRAATLQQRLDALAARVGQMNAHVDPPRRARHAPDARWPSSTTANSISTSRSGARRSRRPRRSDMPRADHRRRRRARRARRRSSTIASASSTVLENLMLNRKLRRRGRARAAGRSTQGYISSHFGSRADPFTGRRAFHKGVDFAGRDGRRGASRSPPAS